MTIQDLPFSQRVYCVRSNLTGLTHGTPHPRHPPCGWHTLQKPYVCGTPGCDKAFAHVSTLTQHRRTHSDDRPFVCTAEGCSGTFRSVARVWKKPWRDGLGVALASPPALLHLLATLHLREPIALASPTTLFPYLSLLHRQAGQLRRHERTVHDGAKQFRCDLCAKLFAAKACRAGPFWQRRASSVRPADALPTRAPIDALARCPRSMCSRTRTRPTCRRTCSCMRTSARLCAPSPTATAPFASGRT